MLLVLAACGKPAEPTSADLFFKEVKSSNPFVRKDGGWSMTMYCCFTDLADPDGRLKYRSYRARACQELQGLLESEREPMVLERIIEPVTPECYNQFPTTVLAGLCRDGCPPDLRSDVIRLLAKVDPSPEIVRRLLAELERPDEMAGGQMLHVSVQLALWNLGEPDLWPTIDALASGDPAVTEAVARGLWSAIDTRAPLELEAVLHALERLQNEGAGESARFAGMAARAYRGWAGVTPEQAVEYVVKNHVSSDAIRLLAVRMFSCRTPAAAAALKRFRSDKDPKIAAAAAHALVFRANRCPRLRE